MNNLFSTLTTLFKRQSEESLWVMSFFCVDISNICDFSRFIMVFIMISDVFYIIDTDLLEK